MNVLRLLSFSLVLFFLLAGTAVADPHEGYYAGASYGLSHFNNVEAKDNLGRFVLDADPGSYVSLTLGYDLPSGGLLGEGRLELEYSQNTNDLTQAKFSNASVVADGTLRVQSLMLNSFTTFRHIYNLTPYAGVGLGIAQVQIERLTTVGQLLIDDDSSVLAGQLGVGVTYDLTPKLRLDLSYRYFLSANPEFTEAEGRRVSVDINAHRTLLGLAWLF